MEYLLFKFSEPKSLNFNIKNVSKHRRDSEVDIEYKVCVSFTIRTQFCETKHTSMKLIGLTAALFSGVAYRMIKKVAKSKQKF